MASRRIQSPPCRPVCLACHFLPGSLLLLLLVLSTTGPLQSLGPEVEELVGRAGKLQHQLKATATSLGAFLDTLQRLSDKAATTSGAAPAPAPAPASAPAPVPGASQSNAGNANVVFVRPQ